MADTLAGTMPDEKKVLLLKTAAEEFVRLGYAGASTNTITRRAGISKGLLFFYYASKKGLYLAILKQAAERLATATQPRQAGGEDAPVSGGIAMLFLSKAACYLSYPLEMEVLEHAQKELSPDIREDIQAILGDLDRLMKERRADAAEKAVARSRLREGVTAAQARECILLALEALDAHFNEAIRGREAGAPAKPVPILGTTQLFLDVVCRGLFE